MGYEALHEKKFFFPNCFWTVLVLMSLLNSFVICLLAVLPPFALGGVENGMRECWHQCHKRSGPCSYCGSTGLCCRRGRPERGCQGQGGDGFHGCVSSLFFPKKNFPPFELSTKNSFNSTTGTNLAVLGGRS